MNPLWMDIQASPLVNMVMSTCSHVTMLAC